MAWSTPATAVVGQILTAAFLNANLRDNLNYLRSSATGYVATNESLVSPTFADLATVGPAVTVTTDVNAMVYLFANISSGTPVSSSMGFFITGATTSLTSNADRDPWSISCAANGSAINLSGAFLVTGLTPGSNTFTAKYRSVGTGFFIYRRITVVPA